MLVVAALLVAWLIWLLSKVVGRVRRDPVLESAWVDDGGRKAWVTFTRYRDGVLTFISGAVLPPDQPLTLLVGVKHASPRNYSIVSNILARQRIEHVEQYVVRPQAMPALVEGLLNEAFPRTGGDYTL